MAMAEVRIFPKIPVTALPPAQPIFQFQLHIHYYTSSNSVSYNYAHYPEK